MSLGVDAHRSQHHHPPTPHRWAGHKPPVVNCTASVSRDGEARNPRSTSREHPRPQPRPTRPRTQPSASRWQYAPGLNRVDDRESSQRREPGRCAGWLGAREFRARAGRVGPRSASRTGRALTAPSPATRRHHQHESSPYFVKSSSPILSGIVSCCGVGGWHASV